MSSQEIYDNYLSNGFLARNSKINEQKIINLYKYNYQKYLPDQKRASILEVGFGLGIFLNFLTQEKYSNLTGVEISSEAYKYTKQKTKIKNLILIKSLEQYLLKNKEKFDLICLNDVLEHIEKEKIIPLLKLLKDSLKNKGTLLLKVPNTAGPVGLRIRYDDFTHQVGFTEASLKQVLQAAGFKNNNIEVKPFSFPKNSLFRLIRFYLQKTVHLFWKLLYWIEYTSSPKLNEEVIFSIAKK